MAKSKKDTARYANLKSKKSSTLSNEVNKIPSLQLNTTDITAEVGVTDLEMTGDAVEGLGIYKTNYLYLQ